MTDFDNYFKDFYNSFQIQIDEYLQKIEDLKYNIDHFKEDRENNKKIFNEKISILELIKEYQRRNKEILDLKDKKMGNSTKVLEIQKEIELKKQQIKSLLEKNISDIKDILKHIKDIPDCELQEFDFKSREVKLLKILE